MDTDDYIRRMEMYERHYRYWFWVGVVLVSMPAWLLISYVMFQVYLWPLLTRQVCGG